MKLDHILLELHKHNFFRSFNMEEMNALFQEAQYRDIANHKALFSQGQNAESFAVVVHGGFKVIKPTTQKQKPIMHFASAGDLLGAMFMFQDAAHYSVSVVALGPSAALEIPKKTFKLKWDINPKVREKLQAHFFNRIQELQEHQAQSAQSLSIKISELFLSLARKGNNSNAATIPFPLTRQEIADYVGASVESVIRGLKEMSDYIETSEKKITVTNISGLSKFSASLK